MTEFSIGERKFRAAAIGPKLAFHIGRRLAPVLGGFKDLAPFLGDIKADDFETVTAILKPIADAMAAMPEEDADYILNHCLEAVTVEIDGGKGWTPVQVNGNLMFDWVTMPMMLQMVWRVVQKNVASFLPEGGPAG